MVGETWILTLYVVLGSGGGGGGGLGNTSVLKLFRLVRLTRMARMAKLLRAIPELIILVKGMAVASRSVGFTLVLLGVIVYFFAIVFRQLTDDTDLGNEVFSTVPQAMATLLLDGVLPDQAGIVRVCGDAHGALGALSLIFVLLATLTVMNMLVGVLCEVVSVVSSVEKESLAVTYVKMRLTSMFAQEEDEANYKITKEKFSSMLMSTEAARTIQEVGVDVVGLVDFSDYIFKDTQTLSFGDFMELILSLRGSNTSTVKDIVDLRKFITDSVNSELKHVKEELLTAIAKLNHQTKKELTQRMSTFPGAGLGGGYPVPGPTQLATKRSLGPMAIADAGGDHSTIGKGRPARPSSALEYRDVDDEVHLAYNNERPHSAYNNEREQLAPTRTRASTNEMVKQITSGLGGQDKSPDLPIAERPRSGQTAPGNTAPAQAYMQQMMNNQMNSQARYHDTDPNRDDPRQASKIQRPTSSGSYDSAADRELARRLRQNTNSSRPGTTESARSRAESPPLPKFSRQMWAADEAPYNGRNEDAREKAAPKAGQYRVGIDR
jgi:hypothetical protein